VEKPEGRGLLFKFTRRCKNDIKIYTYWGGVDWIYPTKGRGKWRDCVNTVMKLRDP
jgi:hypothetical protein